MWCPWSCVWHPAVLISSLHLSTREHDVPGVRSDCLQSWHPVPFYPFQDSLMSLELCQIFCCPDTKSLSDARQPDVPGVWSDFLQSWHLVSVFPSRLRDVPEVVSDFLMAWHPFSIFPAKLPDVLGVGSDFQLSCLPFPCNYLSLQTAIPSKSCQMTLLSVCRFVPSEHVQNQSDFISKDPNTQKVTKNAIY